MEMLGEELSKPAHSTMRHNITGIVEAALRTSASAGEDTVYDFPDSLPLAFNNSFRQLPRSRARCADGGVQPGSGRAACLLSCRQVPSRDSWAGMGRVCVGVPCRRTAGRHSRRCKPQVVRNTAWATAPTLRVTRVSGTRKCSTSCGNSDEWNTR